MQGSPRPATRGFQMEKPAIAAILQKLADAILADVAYNEPAALREPDGLEHVDDALRANVGPPDAIPQRYLDTIVSFGSGLAAVANGSLYVEGAILRGGVITFAAWIEASGGQVVDADGAGDAREPALRLTVAQLVARWGRPLPLASPADQAAAEARLRDRMQQ